MIGAAKRLALPAAIVLCHVYNFPYLPDVMANEKARAYATMALVDRGTLDIREEILRHGYTPDVSHVGDRRYSNKAPGASLLGVPVYGVLRLFGEPTLRATIWALRVFAVTLPCLLLLLPFARLLARVAPEPGPFRAALVGYALGSLALPYSILFMGHQLAAALVGAAFAWLADARPRRALWAGLACGAAILVEYQAALAASVLAVYALRVVGVRRTLTSFAVGALPGIAALALYHTIAFGAPWRTGTWLVGPELQPMLADVSPWPQRAKLWHALVSPRHGLLAFSPWLALALPGVVVLFCYRQESSHDASIVGLRASPALSCDWQESSRRASVVGLRASHALWRQRRAQALACAAVVAAFIWFGGSLAPWQASWDVGPRYLACLGPFAAVAAAAALSAGWPTRWRGAALGLVVASVVIHTLVVTVLPYYPPSYTNPFVDVTLAYLRAGRVTYNAGMLLGLRGVASVAPYLAVVAALIGWMLAPRPRRFTLVALVVAALHLGGLALVERHGSASTRANLELNWEP
ncbi:MAG: hypothetical protein AABZ30_07680 [Myxococcota bacterium]